VTASAGGQRPVYGGQHATVPATTSTYAPGPAHVPGPGPVPGPVLGPGPVHGQGRALMPALRRVSSRAASAPATTGS
jgi:hypothetical protein